MISSINRIRKLFNISTKSSDRFYYFYSTSFLISLSESFLILERFQELHLFIQQINLDFSTFVMKSITFKNQISNHFFKFSIEIIHLLREHCNIISISLAKDLVFFVSMIDSISSHQKRQESSDEKSVSTFDIESIHCVEEYLTTSFIYLVNQRSSQISAMCSISSLSSNFDSFNFRRDIDLFNSSLFCFDLEIRQFNDVTSFLRNLEHCQRLYRYRRTKSLEYML